MKKNRLVERGILNDKENRDAEHWHQYHRCKRSGLKVLQITCTPTGIGHKIVVRCLNCNKSKDISDYACW